MTFGAENSLLLEAIYIVECLATSSYCDTPIVMTTGVHRNVSLLRCKMNPGWEPLLQGLQYESVISPFTTSKMVEHFIIMCFSLIFCAIVAMYFNNTAI